MNGNDPMVRRMRHGCVRTAKKRAKASSLHTGSVEMNENEHNQPVDFIGAKRRKVTGVVNVTYRNRYVGIIPNGRTLLLEFPSLNVCPIPSVNLCWLVLSTGIPSWVQVDLPISLKEGS